MLMRSKLSVNFAKQRKPKVELQRLRRLLSSGNASAWRRKSKRGKIDWKRKPEKQRGKRGAQPEEGEEYVVPGRQ
jgi:hypothetical protein